MEKLIEKYIEYYKKNIQEWEKIKMLLRKTKSFFYHKNKIEIEQHIQFYKNKLNDILQQK